MTTGDPRTLAVPKWPFVLVASLCFALSFGLNFAVGNQSSYLIPALRLIDPDLFARDWFATQTTHYHPFYTHFAAPLLALDSSGMLLAGVFVLTVTLATASLYRIFVATLGSRLALAAFLLYGCLLLLSRTRGPGTTYVFDHVLQPSTLGSALVLGSFACFVEGRVLLSSALLAAAMCFHMNLGPLLFGAFGLAHLFLGRADLVRRVLVHFALPALVFLAFLPAVLRVTGTHSDAETARNIYLYLRASHHYAIAQDWSAFLPLAAWSFLGLATALPLARRPAEVALRRLIALASGASVIVLVGSLAALVSSQLAVNFAWRIAAHAELLWQAAGVAAVVRVAVEPGLLRAYSRGARGLVVSAFVAALAVYAFRDSSRLFRVVLVFGLTAASGLVALYLVRSTSIHSSVRKWASRFRRAAPEVLALAFALLFLSFVVGPLGRLPVHSSLLQDLPKAEAELYAWMRSTPRDTLFLTPPDMDELRIHSRRSIVVDWKGNPAVPSEVTAWYRRIEDVTGKRGLRSPADLAGYASLDPARLRLLQSRYDVDYAVVRRPHAARLGGQRIAFENAGFVVFVASPADGVARDAR